jgi:hypothetical protein
MRLVLKELSCMFQVPRELLEETRIVVIDHKYAKKKEETRRCEVVLQFRSNDKWVNAHSRVGMCMWGANMDISLLISDWTTVNYVAKYCAKKKTPSAGF